MSMLLVHLICPPRAGPQSPSPPNHTYPWLQLKQPPEVWIPRSCKDGGGGALLPRHQCGGCSSSPPRAMHLLRVVRWEVDRFLVVVMMWSCKSNRQKLYPVVYISISNDGAVRCCFPPAFVVMLFCKVSGLLGENITPARRMGDDSVFNIVSLKASPYVGSGNSRLLINSIASYRASDRIWPSTQ